MALMVVSFLMLGISMSVSLAQPVFVIGESKIASHAALDADQGGFVAGLADSGFVEGKNLTIIRADAQGSREAAINIAKDFLERKVDLLHTISTPSTLAALNHQGEIPIVFSSVTDPISAGIVIAPDSAQGAVRDIHIGTGGESSGRNLTGVSDLWPVEMQMRLYQRLLASAQVWGTIYNPDEPNSVLHIQKMRAIAMELGIVLLEATISESSQVYCAAESLLPRVDAFVITSDNTTVNNLDALIEFAKVHQIPVFAGDIDSVRRGAVAAFGMDYFLVGYAAGRKAGLILQGVSPVDIPWGPLAKFSFIINQDAARAQGVDIHPRMLRIADEVIDSGAAAKRQPDLDNIDRTGQMIRDCAQFKGEKTSS